MVILLPSILQGKFFKGLASSGATACYDELNRIDLEVLSVIAQQILCIQLAIQAKLKRFIFEDTEIDLNMACCVMVSVEALLNVGGLTQSAVQCLMAGRAA